MSKRLAKKIAQQHIELRYPQQPLRLQPDYGEKNAADFLGDDEVISEHEAGMMLLQTGRGAEEAEETESFEIVDDIGLDRMAKDHEESGSYMSRQNLREIDDMADFIVDDIGMENLDDWVEDKISHAHAAMNDVARYRGYRDDHPHGEESNDLSFKLADDEIIDDMGIMAEFDKESRVKSRKHHSKGDVEKSMKEHGLDKNPEWKKYEGCMTPKGLDPACINKNKSQGGGGGGGLSALDRLGPAKKPSSGGGLDALSRLANDYNINIDDLEW